jgi:Acetyltransferase (isoleucine patch superfamily)
MRENKRSLESADGGPYPRPGGAARHFPQNLPMSWIWIDGGNSLPQDRTWGQRFALWFGRRLATRHAHVEVHPTAKISPEARIHPREGKIRIGPRCTIAAGATVQGNVELGENVSVQTGSILIGYGTRENPDGRICIGNDVRIAPFVQMIAANHRFDDTTRPITTQGLIPKPILLEDDIWVAGRVIITAGVTVGRGSVLAAGAVVTKDVPPWSVCAGVPARVLKSRKP